MKRYLLLPYLLVQLGCAGSNGDALEVAPDEAKLKYTVHLGKTWYEFRSATLGMSEREVRERDENISDKQPPSTFWDEQIAVEVAAIWSGLCTDCHGGRRSISEARTIPQPPAGWGTKEGVFFGRTKPHWEVFHTVFNGGQVRNQKPSEMPAWGTRLSREQIWALVYYIEYQSGGSEGSFPPSLYPKSDRLRSGREGE